MPEQVPVKAERIRTFTGCRTCRRRHNKCDETRPTCKACKQAGLSCGGYSPRLIWASDIAGQDLERLGDDEAQTRFPLFSNAERESLSYQLSQSLGSRAAEDVLLDLKAALRSSRNDNTMSVHKGPFGAFQISNTECPTHFTDSHWESLTSMDSEEVQAPNVFDENDDSAESNKWASQLDYIDIDSLDMSLEVDVDLDFQQVFGNDNSLNFDLGTDLPNVVDDDVQPIDCDPSSTSKDTRYEESNFWNGSVPNSLLNALSTNIKSPGVIALEEAPLLLRYYKKHIDTASAAIGAKRISPWQLIFLPCAFQTLGELTSLGDASHIRTSILCAILSRSAFHFCKTLSDPKQIDYWRTIGTTHGSNARKHLQKALEEATPDSGEADYEDLLMGFLAMALTLLYQGGRAPRCLLQDAERLILFRGRGSQSSQNARILHHVYTYLRVLVESVPAPQEVQDKEAGTMTLAIRSSPTRFRISEESLNVGLDPDYEKTSDVGYSDYHLEVQGRWVETLHSTIHGVPESLMTLLAQTTSLANEIVHLEHRTENNAKLARDLKRHTKTLEERVWSWCLDPDLRLTSNQKSDRSLQNLIEHPQTQSMIRALHQALIVYFYRRVYDVSPKVLQNNVQQALSHLEACMDNIAADEDFTPCIAWATLIISSAATLPENRSRALKCVEVIDGIGFHYTDEPLKQVIMSTWEGQGT